MDNSDRNVYKNISKIRTARSHLDRVSTRDRDFRKFSRFEYFYSVFTTGLRMANRRIKECEFTARNNSAVARETFNACSLAWYSLYLLTSTAASTPVASAKIIRSPNQSRTVRLILQRRESSGR